MIQLICIATLIGGFLTPLVAQSSKLEFKLLNNGKEYKLDQKVYQKSLKDSIKVSLLKFYVGQFKSELSDPNYHLIDFSEKTSIEVKLKNKQPLSFYLGVDSLTTEKGIGEGDLSPRKGMYWTWNTGYINFKIEGKYPGCDTRRNKFEFHLGGFLGGYPTSNLIELNHNMSSISIDIEQLIEALDLNSRCKLMSPGEEASTLMKKIAQTIK